MTIANAGRVVLGVSGSIASFKAATLASRMVTAGLEVRAVLTAGGARFVTPLTFQSITGNPVPVDVWDELPGRSRMGHLELARWADLLLVAPASANTIAKLALGLADDMLSSTVLASSAPLVVAPAMETTMWTNPVTQDHLETLLSRGAIVLGPEHGRLASGVEGAGRMAEPDDILAAIQNLLSQRRELSGWRVLVTAGPTYEALDPVRFIGNRSSGKMGYAVAAEAHERGADVLLITGPSAETPPQGVETIRVETAEEMDRAVLSNVEDQNVIVMVAAVSDFRPAHTADNKLKRSERQILDLVTNRDIAFAAAQAAPGAYHVGFALETENLIESAREKLQRKGQNMVVANLVGPENRPFGSNTNRVVLVTRDEVKELPQLPKREIARRLWTEIRSRVVDEGTKQV